MADCTITSLPSGSSVSSDDVVIFVDSPGGSPSTRQITIGNLVISLQSLLTASSINGFNSAVSGILPVKNIIAGTGISISSTSGIFTVTNALCASGSMAGQFSNNVNITGGNISGVNLIITSGTITGITDLAIADGGTGASTASGARTNLGLGTIATQNASGVSITGGSITGVTISNITDLTVADGGTGASSASGARTNLGLGTMAVQNSGNVKITGGSISGITDLAIADGGTGASNATTARSNLGLGTMATQNASGVAITGGTIAGITWTGSISTSGLTCTGGTITNITDLAINDGGTGASTASGARANLGLGSMATQNSANISVTGGNMSGVSVNLPTTTIIGGTGISVSRSGVSFIVSATTSGTGGSVALSGLTDVTISTPVSGNILAYNGNKWVNKDVNVNISGSLSSLKVDNIKIDNSSISGISASYSVNGFPNGAIVIEPNSTGPLQGSYDGDGRGNYATDWQRSRVSGEQIACGDYSVLCGGQNNIIGPSGYGAHSVIGGGYGNRIYGNENTIVGGRDNTINIGLVNGSIGGGKENVINNSYSVIAGGYQAKTRLYAESSHAAGYFAYPGDAQKSTLVLRVEVSGNNPTPLGLGGGYAGLPVNSVWTYTSHISSLRNNGGSYDAAAGFIIRGCVRTNSAGFAYDVGSPIVDSFKDSAMSAVDAIVAGNNSSGYVDFIVTGLSGYWTRWVATVDLSQVSYGTP